MNLGRTLQVLAGISAQNALVGHGWHRDVDPVETIARLHLFGAAARMSAHLAAHSILCLHNFLGLVNELLNLGWLFQAVLAHSLRYLPTWLIFGGPVAGLCCQFAPSRGQSLVKVILNVVLSLFEGLFLHYC